MKNEYVKHYTKKPVTIQAICFEDDSVEVLEAIGEMMGDGNVLTVSYKKSVPYIEIDTLEGTMKASLGDYIIRGIKGEFYPCKPDIFWKSYDHAVELPDGEIPNIKLLRQNIDKVLQEVKVCAESFPSREKSLSITKLQEGVMWLGMDLKRLNEPNPYPSSKDPSTGNKIEPTADNLKL